MVLRRSRHGFFLGCSGYPECSTIIPCNETGEPHKLVTEKELEEPCEDCGQGTMTVKRAGARLFLGCDRYPKCKSTSPLPEGVRLERKETPVEETGFGCERCGRPMRIKSGRRGKFIACSGFPKCRNTKPVEKLEELLKLAAEGKLPITDNSDAVADGKKGAPGSAKVAARRPIKKGEKVDIEALGPPPTGYAWTRTGRPVVETWPEDLLYCPQCGKEMTLRSGRFGPFYSCSNFRSARHPSISEGRPRNARRSRCRRRYDPSPSQPISRAKSAGRKCSFAPADRGRSLAAATIPSARPPNLCPRNLPNSPPPPPSSEARGGLVKLPPTCNSWARVAGSSYRCHQRFLASGSVGSLSRFSIILRRSASVMAAPLIRRSIRS